MFDLIPFGRSEKNLFRYLDNMEKSFLGDFGRNFSEFRTDIIDKGDKYILEAELPGFEKKDIKIDLIGNSLRITAEHDENSEEKKDNYIRRERKYGSFSREFDVTGIDTGAIKANYDKGVLTLDLPKSKPEPSTPGRQIEIE